jgi:hypothetical protein
MVHRSTTMAWGADASAAVQAVPKRASMRRMAVSRINEGFYSEGLRGVFGLVLRWA